MAACSRQASLSSANDELEILQSIYLDEIHVTSTNLSRTILYTVKAENGDDSKHFYSVQLEVIIPNEYPSVAPEVSLKYPKGLNDEDLNVLKSQIDSFIHQHKGQPVLFDIIQIAQEFLSSTDVPKLPCSICLNNFHPVDKITVTKECHHYFHSVCLGRYVEHVLEEKKSERGCLPPSLRDSVTDEVVCPLCRCVIAYDLPSLLGADSPKYEVDGDSFDWSDLSNPIEKFYNDLYAKQKEKGGLIDVDEEQKRLLVTEDTRIVLPPSSSGASLNLMDATEGNETVKRHFTDKQTVRLDVNIGDSSDKPSHSVKRTYAPRIYSYRGAGGGGGGGGGGGHYRRKYHNNNYQQHRNSEASSRNKTVKPNKLEGNDNEQSSTDNNASSNPTPCDDVNMSPS